MLLTSMRQDSQAPCLSKNSIQIIIPHGSVKKGSVNDFLWVINEKGMRIDGFWKAERNFKFTCTTKHAYVSQGELVLLQDESYFHTM